MSTAFVAKLYVSSVERGTGAPDTVHVKFAAVTRGDASKSWAEATPQASFDMTIQNPEVVPFLRLGQEFYVRFDPAEPVPSLADGHEYRPSQFERDNPDRYPWQFRCEACNCKRASHEEPLRSQIVSAAGL